MSSYYHSSLYVSVLFCKLC